MNNDFKIHFTDGTTLIHYGIKRRSGRYPWGSGERPYQGDPEPQRKKESRRGNKSTENKGNRVTTHTITMTPDEFNSFMDRLSAGGIDVAPFKVIDNNTPTTGEESFKAIQKDATEKGNMRVFDKMKSRTDIDTVRKMIDDADKRGWASKEFMNMFRTWDFANHYYDNEFSYFALPDEIKSNIDKSLKLIEDRYYWKDGTYKGEYKLNFDPKSSSLNINIPDAHWRLQREKNPNLDKNSTPPSMREENKWMYDFTKSSSIQDILDEAVEKKNFRLIGELLLQDPW